MFYVAYNTGMRRTYEEVDDDYQHLLPEKKKKPRPGPAGLDREILESALARVRQQMKDGLVASGHAAQGPDERTVLSGAHGRLDGRQERALEGERRGDPGLVLQQHEEARPPWDRRESVPVHAHGDRSGRESSCPPSRSESARTCWPTGPGR
jgi:hypothetical protein